MTLTISSTLARQLAVTKQDLAGTPPEPSPESILNVVRDLGCLQLDPTSAVARSHLLVLWSRLGNYDPADVDRLLWEDRSLFEYWAHAAAIVLTEDYPIHHHEMQKLRTHKPTWKPGMLEWIEANPALRDHILEEIREKGALPSSAFEDKADSSWQSSGWTGNRNVGQMLTGLWDRGFIVVAGRKGTERLWDLPERFLPDWTPRDELTDYQVVYLAAQKSLRALGVARIKDIQVHYTRNRYPGLPEILKDLEKEGRIQQIKIVDSDKALPGTWYIHTDDLPLLEQLEKGEFQPRTTLLSPFDNLICDRARTEKLFNFEFKIEIYVPKEKRQYGYYVLPILHGDKLIGRIDPLMNRKEKRLYINNVYAEPDAPMNKSTAAAAAAAIESLATFLGAADIAYAENVPSGWDKVLR
ncbi:MAG: crosslink repair DNA glycosylase YcaQ family protein [Chloroflexota bacterium]